MTKDKSEKAILIVGHCFAWYCICGITAAYKKKKDGIGSVVAFYQYHGGTSNWEQKAKFINSGMKKQKWNGDMGHTLAQQHIDNQRQSYTELF